MEVLAIRRLIMRMVGEITAFALLADRKLLDLFRRPKLLSSWFFGLTIRPLLCQEKSKSSYICFTSTATQTLEQFGYARAHTILYGNLYKPKIKALDRK